MKQRLLNQEQREEIASLVDSANWESLKLLIAMLLEGHERRVLTYPLKQGADGLLHEKARAEGAAELARSIQLEVEKIAASERKAR
jgi:hypothetical protein